MAERRPLVLVSGGLRELPAGDVLLPLGRVSIGTTPPASPAHGDLWWDATSGALAVWYEDGSSTQWVTVSGPAGPVGPAGDPGATGPSSVSTSTASTISGLLKGAAGYLAAALAGTDYVAPGGALGTPSSGNLANCTVDGTTDLGYRNIPPNAQTGNYTLALSDAGKHLYHASGAAAATYTLPANASVAFPLGTAITFVNLSANPVTIAITSDTLYLAGTGATGSRTLAQYGMATALKVATTAWLISGTGLT